jgi:hypothetical protein
MAAKLQVIDKIARLKNKFAQKLGNDQNARTVADYLSDIVWPLFSADIRRAIRKSLVAQIQQMVVDGIDSGFPKDRQKISIIAHSLGCFQVYETLHYVAQHAEEELQPATHGVQFNNVVLMASPVKLIRTVGGLLRAFIPASADLATLTMPDLMFPFERRVYGTVAPCAKRWITVTGNLDPVGGYLFGRKLDWGYMSIPPHDGMPPTTEIVEDQKWCQIENMSDLVDVLKQALVGSQFPEITVNNPHTWLKYVEHHSREISLWFA